MQPTELQNYIQMCRIKKNILSDRELAEKLGITPQNYYSKKKKGSYTLSYLEEIANALGAELEIRFIDKETGKPII